MKHLESAAFGAGARPWRVRTPHDPAFPPVMRKALIPAIRTIRRDLGLSTGDLLVLGALLSFLPCKDPESGAEHAITPGMVLVVFAGNSALCDRANGMDERALRRHISRLCDAGLARRKQSATGKRFPLKRDGMIRDAFGIDLSPLLERHPELSARAQEARRKAEELRAIRAEALALRARALEACDPQDQETRGFLERVKTILRRATLTVEKVQEMIDSIRSLLASTPEVIQAPCPSIPDTSTSMSGKRYHPAEPSIPDSTPVDPAPRSRTSPDDQETNELSGANGQNVRHQDTSQIDIKKRRDGQDPAALWRKCQMVAIMHPDPPKTEQGLLRVIYDFGRITRLDDRALAEAIRAIGAGRVLETLDYIAQNMAKIRCPYSYLRSVMTRRTERRERSAPNGHPA